MILQGDCRDVLKSLDAKSVQCCVTSPPYWGLRDYGVDGQLGLEETPEQYVAKMVELFAEVKRVLRDDGTLWLNLGDSYTSNGESGRQNLDKLGVSLGCGGGKKHSAQACGRASTPSGMRPKNLVGIPWRVAFALQADGWYLRSDIIWHKPNPMPESVTDRPTKSHEYIFLLSKSERYYYDAEAIREPIIKGDAGSRFDTGKTGDHQLGRSQKRPPLEGAHGSLGMDGNGMRMPDKWNNPSGRNKRTVWTIATQPYKEAHFATFPEDLVKPCVLAGSKPGDTVLDPFAGSGTTLRVALELGRKAVGIELNPQYCELAEARTAVTPGML